MNKGSLITALVFFMGKKNLAKSYGGLGRKVERITAWLGKNKNAFFYI